MAYIGKTPASAALTSSDISDGIIITDKLANNAVITSKITDGTITNADIASTVITGQSALTSIASDDTVLISDTSASGALKKMTRANFVSGVGGNNAPLFYALKGGQQQPSDATTTKVQYDTEVYDPSGVYDNSSNYRFTPGVAGYYYIFAGVGITAFGVSLMAEGEINIYKNGNNIVRARHNASNNYQYWIQPTVQTIVQMDDNDYIEIYAKGDVTSSTPIYFYQSSYSWFGGYKIID